MNIHLLMQNLSRTLGAALDHVPHRTTVEQMTKELRAISQLQCAEALLADSNATLAFDATTQEGVHINALVITIETTTSRNCFMIVYLQFIKNFIALFRDINLTR